MEMETELLKGPPKGHMTELAESLTFIKVIWPGLFPKSQAGLTKPSKAIV